jgi:hypothetical protein
VEDWGEADLEIAHAVGVGVLSNLEHDPGERIGTLHDREGDVERAEVFDEGGAVHGNVHDSGESGDVVGWERDTLLACKLKNSGGTNRAIWKGVRRED